MSGIIKCDNKYNERSKFCAQFSSNLAISYIFMRKSCVTINKNSIHNDIIAFINLIRFYI